MSDDQTQKSKIDSDQRIRNLEEMVCKMDSKLHVYKDNKWGIRPRCGSYEVFTKNIHVKLPVKCKRSFMTFAENKSKLP